MKIFFRNKTVLLTQLFMLILGASMLVKSLSVIDAEKAGPMLSFRFLRQQMILMLFPAILTNILTIAFSVTSEKQGCMLSRLVPGGEYQVLRSKAASCAMISSVLSFIYISAALAMSGLDLYLNLSFTLFLIFSFIFTLSGLSFFTVAFAFRFHDGRADYEPDLKRMLVYMAAVSLTVMIFYYCLSLNMIRYYEYYTGFRISYPNKEMVLFLISCFAYMLLTRLLLKSSENKICGEQY